MDSKDSFILFFTLRIPCFCIFVWPLYVAGDEYGRYLCTARNVNPVHVENWLFSMALIRLRFGRLNAAWRRYLMGDTLDVIAYEFLAFVHRISCRQGL